MGIPRQKFNPFILLISSFFPILDFFCSWIAATGLGHTQVSDCHWWSRGTSPLILHLLQSNLCQSQEDPEPQVVALGALALSLMSQGFTLALSSSQERLPEGLFDAGQLNWAPGLLCCLNQAQTQHFITSPALWAFPKTAAAEHWGKCGSWTPVGHIAEERRGFNYF